MEGSVDSQGGYKLRVSRAELVILANALNEVNSEIEEPEFSTRLGGSLLAAMSMQSGLVALLNSEN